MRCLQSKPADAIDTKEIAPDFAYASISGHCLLVVYPIIATWSFSGEMVISRVAIKIGSLVVLKNIRYHLGKFLKVISRGCLKTQPLS